MLVVGHVIIICHKHTLLLLLLKETALLPSPGPWKSCHETSLRCQTGCCPRGIKGMGRKEVKGWNMQSSSGERPLSLQEACFNDENLLCTVDFSWPSENGYGLVYLHVTVTGVSFSIKHRQTGRQADRGTRNYYRLLTALKMLVE